MRDGSGRKMGQPSIKTASLEDRITYAARMDVPSVGDVNGKYGKIYLQHLPIVQRADSGDLFISLEPNGDDEPEIEEMKEVTKKYVSELVELKNKMIVRLAGELIKRGIEDAHS